MCALLSISLALFFVTQDQAQGVSPNMDYSVADTTMQGYLTYDDNI